RTRFTRRLEIAVRGDVLVERHLIRAMTPPPEAMAVPSLIQGDAIDPGPQARLTAEAMDGAEDAKEYFLREIERFVAVAEQVDRQLNDHPLMLSHQFRAGRFVPGCTALHKRRFAAADVRPTRNPRLLHREFHYTNFRPRQRLKVPYGW